MLVLRIISAFKMARDGGEGGDAACSDSLIIVDREMIDDLPDQWKKKNQWKKKILAKNGSHYSRGSHDSHGSHRVLHGSLARRFSRPSYSRQLVARSKSVVNDLGSPS